MARLEDRLDNTALMVGFGERLRLAREQYERREPNKHRQADVARRVGVSHPVYNKWEQGTHLPSLIHLLKIADIFQISMDYLLRGVLPTPRNSSLVAPWLVKALRRAHPEFPTEAQFAAQRRQVYSQLGLEPPQTDNPNLRKTARRPFASRGASPPGGDS